MSSRPSVDELESVFVAIDREGDIGAFMETVIREIYRVWMLKPGNVAIDIGAHKGLHTFKMAEAVGPQGKVLAFEACPDLSKSLRDASFQLGQIEVINKAVSASSAESIRFYKNPQYPGQSTIVSGYGHHFTEEFVIDVQCTSLDDCENLFAKRLLRFIKIDAEGAELPILAGATKVLMQHAPLIAAEISVHKYRGSFGEFTEILDRVGYSAYTLSGAQVTKALLDTGFNSPCYTLLFAKAGHWTSDFCESELKLQKMVRGLAGKWLEKLRSPAR